jgi:hypothetical protein
MSREGIILRCGVLMVKEVVLWGEKVGWWVWGGVDVLGIG